MADEDLKDAAQVMQKIVDLLTRITEEERTRVLGAVLSFFPENLSQTHGVHTSSVSVGSPREGRTQRVAFSEDIEISPKEFLLDKHPMTDIERVACLAYYLTHYRDSPHFLTLDISKLNTEAAQPKFSNSAQTMQNAVKQRYLVSAGKGKMRQLSAGGEQFVKLLPDRKSARAAMQTVRPRRRAKKRVSSKRSNSKK